MTLLTDTVSCAGPDCDRPIHANGFCATHNQQHRHGRPLTPIPIPTIDRVLDVAWCLGGTVTLGELVDRLGTARNTIQRAIQRNPTLIEPAGTIPVKDYGARQSHHVTVWRITPAGLQRLYD